MEEFLGLNTYIRDMNGEGKYLAGVEEGDGGRGVAGLENLILVMFDQDRESLVNCLMFLLSSC